eukprot:gene992-344_t
MKMDDQRRSIAGSFTPGNLRSHTAANNAAAAASSMQAASPYPYKDEGSSDSGRPALSGNMDNQILAASIDAITHKMDRQQIQHEKETTSVLTKMEEITEQFANMKRMVHVQDENTKAGVEKLGREAIEATTMKVLGSARQFMQTEAVALRDHFEQEHEKQKAHLLERIREGAIETMKNEVKRIEGTLKEQTDRLARERVDAMYNETWKDELFEKIKEDSLMSQLQEKIDDTVSSGMDSVRAMVRTQFDMARVELTNYGYSKEESDGIIHNRTVSEAEARNTAVNDLRRLITNLQSGLAEEKAGRETGERSIQDKLREVNEKLDEHAMEHKNIRDLISQQRDEINRRFTEEAEKATARNSDILKKIDVLTREIGDEKQARSIAITTEGERREALQQTIDRNHSSFNQFSADVNESNNQLKEKMQTLENGAAVANEMRKDMEERMQRSVDSRFDDVGSQLASVRSEIQAINDATNDSAGKNDVHQQAIDQIESLLAQTNEQLGQAQDKIIQIVEDNAKGAETFSEEVKAIMNSVEDVKNAQDVHLSQTKQELANQSRQVDEEITRVNSDFNFWKEVIDKDQVARRDHSEILTAKIADMRAAILADQKSMKKQLDDCTRDVQNVLKPFLEDAGVDLKLGTPEHPASLLRSLAQTCLDWQAEHRKLRDKVEKSMMAFATSEERIKHVSQSHEWMTEHLQSSSQQIKEVYQQVCVVSSEVAAWAKRRRSPEEDEIEETFLKSMGVKPRTDTPKLDTAMHDFLMELTRQRVQMEGQMSGQLNELQQFVWESSKALVDRQRGYHKVLSELNRRIASMEGTTAAPIQAHADLNFNTTGNTKFVSGSSASIS